MLICDIDKGQDDTDGEDPLGDVNGDGWLDFGRPFVEDKKVDSSESIDSIDSNRDC